MQYRRFTAFLTAILFVAVTVPSVPAQSDGAARSRRTDTDASAKKGEPVPYEESEFPEWLVKVRRFEVITIGSFPAALLLTNLGFSLFRFVQASIEAGTVTGENVPVFFGAAGAQDLTDQERRRVLTISVSISGAVAVLDLILGFVGDNGEPD
jgi:hypothetical protein